MSFNLAEINEVISAAIPERECIVFRDRRISWGEFGERTRRLASYLAGRKLGCRQERSELQNFESGQDHLGIYLYNCPEYLEAMVGSFKARVAPFNVNYRYVDDELIYLLDDADARALVYHARFAPNVTRIRDRLPNLDVLIQVADESGHALLPGAVDYEDALRQSSPQRPAVDLPGDDLYILDARPAGAALHARRRALDGVHGDSASILPTCGRPSCGKRSPFWSSWATPSGGRWSTTCPNRVTTCRIFASCSRAERS